MRLLPVLLLTCACSDYDLSSKKERPPAEEEDDTGTLDTDTDTTDTAEEVHDSGSVTVPDTGNVATEAVYINTDDTLYSFDPSTSRATAIGPFLDRGSPVRGGMTDIAIDLGGIMYGVSFTSLYRINPATGESTYVADVADSMTGLTFVSDGRLVGTGDAVSFVDTTTGRLTSLVRVGEYVTSGDIIGLPDGMLYWTVTGGDVLIQVDPADGNTRRMGSTGVSGIFGLGYAYGALYGFTSSSDVVIIDQANGRLTDEQALSGTWWGATTNPVLW